MASPQTENGFTKIANELLEALARLPELGNEERRVLMVVLRYTYGFNRKTAELSITFIARATGLKRSAVSRGIKGLATRLLLSREKNRITFNKNYEQWVATRKLLATIAFPTSNTVVAFTSNNDVAQERKHKEKEERKDFPKKNQRPFIDNDPVWVDEATGIIKVKIHTGEWKIYEGSKKDIVWR